MLIPVKRLAEAKTRIDLDRQTRADLALAMCRDVVAAASGAPNVDRVQVISTDTVYGNADDLELTLPAAAPDAVASVLVLDFPGQIAANKALRVAGPATLHVMDGRLDGPGIRYGDGKTNRDVTEEWSGAAATVTWHVRVPQAGRFRIAAQYNTHTPAADGAFVVEAAQQALTGTVVPTENVNTFRTESLGEFVLAAGEHTIVVRPVRIAEGHLMRLRQIELTPVE